MWEPTKQAANKRLQSFVSKAGKIYAARRNIDAGAGQHANVSQLSPWIRHRLILEENVLAEVLAKHSFSSAEKYISEVFWRGYFKGWLEHRPQIWTWYKRNLTQQAQQLESDADLSRRYEAAIDGRTGIDCFDHWAEELVKTGYLHNHARMWFASIWIFTLRLPWELGADFFYRNLLDGDPASNTCSWRWVAGLHTKGKSYIARPANIEDFTLGRFKPTGLAEQAIALEEPELSVPTPPQFPSEDFPSDRYGLVFHDEDCAPETLALPNLPSAALALSDPSPRSVFSTASLARDFTSNAVREAARTFETDTGIQCVDCNDSNWSEILEDWVNSEELDALATARLPVGPTRKRLLNACSQLSIPLIEITRPYDRAVWPHASHGFFGLRKQIPGLLAELELC